MKKILITVISLAAVALVAYTLYANKQEMQESAKLAEVSSEYIPVEVTRAENMALSETAQADGTFEAVTDLNIMSETQGKLVAVYKEKGDKVTKGEVLAQVENDYLKAQVEAAKANYEKLKSDLERFTKLSENDAVTKRQLEEVHVGLANAEAQYKSAARNLQNTYIKAEASGVINDDFVQEGLFVSGGMKLYEIVDASKLKLDVNLSATDVLRVNAGDKVQITTAVYPDAAFSGKVTSISEKADGGLKYQVEVELENTSQHRLKPGMYATAIFQFEEGKTALYVNRNALIGSIQNPQVYVIDNDEAALRTLSVGQVQGEYIEVLNGLSAKDQVVLSGQINLAEGTKVKVIERG